VIPFNPVNIFKSFWMPILILSSLLRSCFFSSFPKPHFPSSEYKSWSLPLGVSLLYIKIPLVTVFPACQTEFRTHTSYFRLSYVEYRGSYCTKREKATSSAALMWDNEEATLPSVPGVNWHFACSCHTAHEMKTWQNSVRAVNMEHFLFGMRHRVVW
jgi:hypothetical protein